MFWFIFTYQQNHNKSKSVSISVPLSIKIFDHLLIGLPKFSILFFINSFKLELNHKTQINLPNRICLLTWFTAGLIP